MQTADDTQAADRRWNRRDIVVLVAVAVAFNLYGDLFNSNMFYDPLGWEDPFRHLGIGLYYADPGFWDLYYKISRVPWNTLQFLVRQLFTTAAAGPVLQLICALGRALSLYGMGRWVFRREVALTLGIVSVFLPLFHADGGPDYYNAGAVPLYYLTWALMVAWVARPRWPMAFGLGLATAATLHTCPQFVLTGPMLLIAGAACCRFAGRTLAEVRRAVGVQVAGFFAANVLFALWHVSLGRRAAFYRPQLDLVGELRGANRWWQQFDWSWLQSSTHSAFMAVVGVISLFELVRLTRARAREPRAILYGGIHLGYLATYAVAIVQQARGQTMFQPDYLAQMVVASALLPLACVWQRVIDRARVSDRGPARWVIEIVLPASLLLMLVVAATRGRPYGLPAFIPAAAALLAYYLFARTPIARGALALLPMAVVNAALIVYPDLYTVDLCHGRRHLTTLMVEASRQGSRLVEHPDQLKVWAEWDAVVDDSCSQGTRVADIAASFTAIAHSYLAHVENPAPWSEDAGARGVVAFVTTKADGHDHFRTQAQEAGVQLTELARDRDPKTGVRFYFDAFTRTTPPTPAP